MIQKWLALCGVHTLLANELTSPFCEKCNSQNVMKGFALMIMILIYFRFENVPLVTPNGDVLINDLSFEVKIT